MFLVFLIQNYLTESSLQKFKSAIEESFNLPEAHPVDVTDTMRDPITTPLQYTRIAIQ